MASLDGGNLWESNVVAKANRILEKAILVPSRGNVLPVRIGLQKAGLPRLFRTQRDQAVTRRPAI